MIKICINFNPITKYSITLTFAEQVKKCVQFKMYNMTSIFRSQRKKSAQKQTHFVSLVLSVLGTHRVKTILFYHCRCLCFVLQTRLQNQTKMGNFFQVFYEYVFNYIKLYSR